MPSFFETYPLVWELGMTGVTFVVLAMICWAPNSRLRADRASKLLRVFAMDTLIWFLVVFHGIVLLPKEVWVAIVYSGSILLSVTLMTLCAWASFRVMAHYE